MKALLVLFLLFSNCLASMVVELGKNEEKVVLKMEKGMIINSKSITFCIRFNLEGSLKKPHFLFSTRSDQLFQLVIRVQESIGFVEMTNQSFVFQIPKSAIKQYSWYHFCFTADQNNYQVIVEGKSRVEILAVVIKPRFIMVCYLEGCTVFHIYLKRAHMAAIYCLS